MVVVQKAINPQRGTAPPKFIAELLQSDSMLERQEGAILRALHNKNNALLLDRLANPLDLGTYSVIIKQGYSEGHQMAYDAITVLDMALKRDGILCKREIYSLLLETLNSLELKGAGLGQLEIAIRLGNAVREAALAGCGGPLAQYAAAPMMLPPMPVPYPVVLKQYEDNGPGQ